MHVCDVLNSIGISSAIIFKPVFQKFKTIPILQRTKSIVIACTATSLNCKLTLNLISLSSHKLKFWIFLQQIFSERTLANETDLYQGSVYPVKVLFRLLVLFTLRGKNYKKETLPFTICGSRFMPSVLRIVIAYVNNAC